MRLTRLARFFKTLFYKRRRFACVDYDNTSIIELYADRDVLETSLRRYTGMSKMHVSDMLKTLQQYDMSMCTDYRLSDFICLVKEISGLLETSRDSNNTDEILEYAARVITDKINELLDSSNYIQLMHKIKYKECNMILYESLRTFQHTKTECILCGCECFGTTCVSCSPMYL